MSFIAGYLIGLEEGENYANENKRITANGEYVPNDNVRWDKVVVDVPQTGLAERFDSMNIYWGSATYGDGWYVLLKVDYAEAVGQRYGTFYQYDYIIDGGGEKTVVYEKRWTPQIYLAVYYRGNFMYAQNIGNMGGYNQWRKYVSSDHSYMTSFYTGEDAFTAKGVEGGALKPSIYGYMSFSGKLHYSFYRVDRYNDTGGVINENTSQSSQNISGTLYANGTNCITDLPEEELQNALNQFRTVIINEANKA